MIMPTYVLEMPKEPGEAQKELVQKDVELFNEASCVIISAINPQYQGHHQHQQEKATLETHI